MPTLIHSPKKDWVPTHLLDGDELDDQSTHDVAGVSSLADLYGVSARAIVEGNGVAWRTADINAWVLRTGGKTLSNGQPVFASTSIILLPQGGPREPVGGGVLQTSSARGAYALALGLGALLGVVALKRKSKLAGVAALGCVAGVAIHRGRALALHRGT